MVLSKGDNMMRQPVLEKIDCYSPRLARCLRSFVKYNYRHTTHAQRLQLSKLFINQLRRGYEAKSHAVSSVQLDCHLLVPQASCCNCAIQNNRSDTMEFK